VVEDEKRAALAALPVPTSHALLADATGLPGWLVEIVPAMTFSTGLLVLGFVLVGFASHPHGSQEQTVEASAASEPMPDERERVVDWVREFKRRTGRSPRIPEVQQAFRLKRTTAWRRIPRSSARFDGLPPIRRHQALCELLDFVGVLWVDAFIVDRRPRPARDKPIALVRDALGFSEIASLASLHRIAVGVRADHVLA